MTDTDVRGGADRGPCPHAWGETHCMICHDRCPTSIQKALELLPKSVGGHTSPEVQNISFSFQRPVRFSFERNTQGYITAWVTKGWPDYEVASEMAKNKEWVRLIAQALCLDPSQVSLGFGKDQFDVRPF